MPELVPFAALRYTDTAGDLSFLLAPPYDVIDSDTAEELRSRSEYNCVRLILPEGSEAQRYTNAADTLKRWSSSGILAPDPGPRAYVYRQTFEVGGVSRERLATFASLRLVPLDRGEVLPHERTHSGPKKDRLALTMATRTQLSPVFMVARDLDASLYDAELRALERTPSARAVTPEGTRHDLFEVTGGEASGLLASAALHPLLIADGHHRYETALAAAELLGDNVKAAFLLVCVVSQQDPGLDVRPTHRILTRPPDAAERYDWGAALADVFALQEFERGSAGELERAVAAGPPGSFIVCPGAGAVRLATPRPRALERAGIAAERGRISPAVFDELVLRRLYGLAADQATREGVLTYARQPEAATGLTGVGCGFIMPPVSLDDVWATAQRGGRLPPKSTYFEPKIPSGLLFRSL